MWRFDAFGILLLSWVFLMQITRGLQNSQTQALLQLRKHLEYPSALELWENFSGDLCYVSSTAHMSISCQDNSITELKVTGDKLSKAPQFGGIAVPNQTLSESFSIDSVFTTLARLTNLRVLSLVSLGIWGPLPDKVHRLSSLEYLDLSSNFMFGSVPPQVSGLVKLHTLILDHNYFNGSIPERLDSITNLAVLSLKNNRFKGHFPSSVCRISSLTNIALSHNEISGELPDLSALTSLHVLDLRENDLDSGLPSMPRGLVTLLLSKNSFSGKIPDHFGRLRQLQHLDLSFNQLRGTPSLSLFALPDLSYLDLASNELSGTFSKHLNCGNKLGFVDISNNKLTGELPSCLDSLSGQRVVKIQGNCLSINDQGQHKEVFCKEANSAEKGSRGISIGMLVAVIGGAILFLVLLAFGALVICRKSCPGVKLKQHTRTKILLENQPLGVSSEVLASARLISNAVKFGTQGAPVCRSFSMEELMEATDDFDKSTFLGEGSIGKLYKGRLKTGTYVTIRSLALSKKVSFQNLKAQLEWLSKIQHPNLVSFLGHCVESNGYPDSVSSKLFLVYEYVPNGNYRTHLSEANPEKVLTWPDRLAILVEVAKGVHFLHTGVIPGSFNNRLKTHSILLDEHRIAKLSDYGLSIVTEENEGSEAKRDGQKARKKGRVEDDVYNFGFVLLESLLGPVAGGKGETFLLNEMASFGSQDGRRRIVDPMVLTTSCQESLSIVVSITKKCMSSDPSKRPSVEDILWNLQYAAQVQADADTDQRSDSTT